MCQKKIVAAIVVRDSLSAPADDSKICTMDKKKHHQPSKLALFI